MTAITTRMNVAIPGAVSRSFPGQVISQEVIDSANPPTAYGQPVKLVNGKVRTLASGDAAGVIYGITVRPYPTQDATGAASGYGAGTPPTSGIIDVMKVGFIGATLANGTAAKGAQAYVRTTVNGSLAIGGIEDNTTSSGLVAPSLYAFTGPADAAGNVEISVGIPY
ncbi:MULTISPECIES: hypothetical protein [unclassified Novosphingobium]|uniref:structural cement protein Gp24 n=1 Tax=unclassified Novosphingobium TaxID=2644732 RepID=UPI000D41FFA5|nr:MULTISPECIES: hypothetical protein [unclassified Novosphingobium]PTR06436.1 hypothetical protein C8K11_12049 [Novosphingobium sp. GV055]PUA94855.1 hypothetical protein C8K12_12049 [Novosphingobium sp. GV061]PUB13780.1 hypothetical protein C8K14_12049 [Novosphingobium sp. GV079]PUB38478.1 hypothetical protein C8K10_12049 [Novosphingobium sp. GV027]